MPDGALPPFNAWQNALRDLIKAFSAFSLEAFIGLEIKDGQVHVRHRDPAATSSSILAEPILYGLPLIRHSVCSNHRVLHDFARQRANEPLIQTRGLFVFPPI